jgi:hypothetical protein
VIFVDGFDADQLAHSDHSGFNHVSDPDFEHGVVVVDDGQSDGADHRVVARVGVRNVFQTAP